MSAQKPHSAEVSTLIPSQEKPRGGVQADLTPPGLSGICLHPLIAGARRGLRASQPGPTGPRTDSSAGFKVQRARNASNQHPALPERCRPRRPQSSRDRTRSARAPPPPTSRPRCPTPSPSPEPSRAPPATTRRAHAPPAYPSSRWLYSSRQPRLSCEGGLSPRNDRVQIYV